MAQLVNFSGIRYATSTAEAFYGTGSFDTVSYEGAPSSGAVGDYDVGVKVDLYQFSLTRTCVPSRVDRWT